MNIKLYIGISVLTKKGNKYNGSNEYQKAIDFLEKGCNCGCSSKIPKEGLAELRGSFQALSKTEQDIFLMAQLKAMDGGSISASRCLKKKTRSSDIRKMHPKLYVYVGCLENNEKIIVISQQFYYKNWN